MFFLLIYKGIKLKHSFFSCTEFNESDQRILVERYNIVPKKSISKRVKYFFSEDFVKSLVGCQISILEFGFSYIW